MLNAIRPQLIRRNHPDVKALCNRSGPDHISVRFQNFAVCCQWTLIPHCRATCLEMCDGSCLPRVASINPLFWQHGYEVPAKSGGLNWSMQHWLGVYSPEFKAQGFARALI